MKVSLDNRLKIGFATAILLVLIVGISSYKTYINQSEESNWVKHTYEVMYSVQQVKLTLANMRSDKSIYRVTSDTSFLFAYERNLQRVVPEIEDLEQLVADNEAQLNRVRQLQTNVSELLLFWRSNERTSKNAGNEALALLIKTESDKFNTIEQSVEDITAHERQLLAQRTENNKSLIKTAVYVLAGGIVLILLIVSSLIFLIINEFNRRALAEENLRKNIEELNLLNEETEDKNWMLSGVTEINNSVQGVNESGLLARQTLHAIVKYLELPGGAFYVYNNEQQLFKLYASVAVQQAGKTIYTTDEMPGMQALQQKEVVVLKDVPADYLRIESASISANAVEIAYVPLVLNGSIEGLLELTSFKPFNERQVEFVKVVSNNIAVALHSTETNETVMKLLSQVQEQKEELVHQQEELKQANEELTRQTEILQTSEEELRVQEEELRQINVELEEKNEVVENARLELVQKAKELEVTSKYKSEFLANMSHELRTPLNSILILAKLLSENKAKNLSDKQVENARIIYQSGNNLLELINDILDLSKIEAGKIELNIEEVAVATIERDMQQLFEAVADEKEIRFITEVGEGVPTAIQTDKQRLEQIVKNLLSNAFKFTEKQGTVKLHFYLPINASFVNTKLEATDKVLAIAVTDTGIGIPFNKQQIIFEAFQQVDGSTSRKYGGTGLGLSISKELAYRLGGEIRLKSKEKEGSSFILYVPFALDKLAQELLTQNNVLNSSEHTAVAEVVEDDRYDIKKGERTILIVEDDVRFATVLKDFAKEKNYRAIVALTGDEGLHMARKYRPDAIILDMQLPVINGWSVLKLLKADPELKDIPVHIISGMDDMRLNDSLAYLKKPVRKEDLENIFDSINTQLLSSVRRVLVLSGHLLKDEALRKIKEETRFDVEYEYAASPEAGLQLLQLYNYDIVIADIGKDISQGLADIQRLKDESGKSFPIIVYLDKDISLADELKLKKVSDVIIMNSSKAEERLIDELELFLHKIQEHPQSSSTGTGFTQQQDNALLHKKVLLVDDDMRNLFALTALLEEQSMNVITASDGREAIEKLQNESRIDIVLMDIMMPEMDGYEAISKIRNDLQLTRLPVIALTAKAMTGDKEKAIQAGASDYITKPVNTGKLFSLLRVWLTQ